MSKLRTTLDGNCGICNQAELELLSTVDRYRQNLKTAVCRDCGMVQHAHIPSNEELAEFYSSQYRLAYNGESTPGVRRIYREWFRAQERFNVLKKLVQPGERVFEVGSGIGCNLKHFENYGCTVAGIEPGEGFSRFSRDQMRINVRCAFLEDLDPGVDAGQSMVLLTHVLEHLPNPVASLQMIGKLLKPNGHLYVEVPNFGLPHAAPDKVFHYGHIYNFTEISLLNTAHLAGYKARPVAFGPESLGNLSFVLTPDENAKKLDIIKGYEMSVAAHGRYTSLSYRLRWTKLVEARQKALERINEQLFAKSFVNQLLAEAANGAARKVHESSFENQRRAA